MKTDKEPERGTEAPRNSRAEGGHRGGDTLKPPVLLLAGKGTHRAAPWCWRCAWPGSDPNATPGWCPGGDRTGIIHPCAWISAQRDPIPSAWALPARTSPGAAPCRVWNSSDPTEIPVLAASHLFRFPVPSHLPHPAALLAQPRFPTMFSLPHALIPGGSHRAP